MDLPAPGFYGKLPSCGDFVSRRLPIWMAAPWDEWLAEFTLAVQEQAGGLWPQVWLTAPLWHFTIGGAIWDGTTAQPAAAGILVASMDRVGRMFPFTIVAPSCGEPILDWSAAAEQLALDALEEDANLDRLDVELTQLGAPAAPSAIDPHGSLWWCHGSERVPQTRFELAGLPDPGTAVSMVLGAGSEHNQEA
jgi:type VI secretion system protein ImpM